HLGSAGPHSVIRGGNRLAKFYRFDAVKGANVHFAIDQATVRTHAYLYDRLGRIVASSSHTGVGETGMGARFTCKSTDIAASETVDYWLPFGYGDLCLEATGRYILEVATHCPDEEGDYILTFDRRAQFCTERLEFQVDGRTIPFGGVVDFAGTASKSVHILNRGDTDVTEDTLVSVAE